MKRNKMIPVFCALLMFITGCQSSPDILRLYNADTLQSEFSYFQPADLSLAKPFAADLCVLTDESNDTLPEFSAESASLYCIDTKEILYAKNIHAQMNPASLTKVMTAILAIESGKLGDMVTITEEAMITEANATLCDLKPGDQVSLENLLKCSIVRSGNDAAAAIAVYLGGSISGFADMMNERAHSLGATNSHFVNPHGLTEDNHYITAYDMYIIMQKALQYEEFLSIVRIKDLEFSYIGADGTSKDNSFSSTNRYITGTEEAPDGITIVGGKTGTTEAAGSCMALISRDPSGKWYCSVLLKADGADVLYTDIAGLLELK